MKKSKTNLLKLKKSVLLDMLREEYPFKPKFFYEYYEKEATKGEIVAKLLKAY